MQLAEVISRCAARTRVPRAVGISLSAHVAGDARRGSLSFATVADHALLDGSASALYERRARRIDRAWLREAGRSLNARAGCQAAAISGISPQIVAARYEFLPAAPMLLHYRHLTRASPASDLRHGASETETGRAFRYV